MKRENIWLMWDQFVQIAEGRRIVFFGRGEWVTKTIPYLPSGADYIVDNNRYEQGQTESGLEIFNPDKLQEENWDEILVVITTSGFIDVSAQLDAYGMRGGVHYIVSPSLKNYETVAKVHAHSGELLLTCSDRHLPDNDEVGGGLYRYDTDSKQIEKVINGLCHGITQSKDNLFLVDDVVGVRIMDKDLNGLGIIELPGKSRPHGIAYDEVRNLLYVNLSGRDAVGVLDIEAGKLVDELSFSRKMSSMSTAQHHLNDICCYGDSLYVSMFSYSGNWKRGVYDGAIVELDLVERTTEKVVVSDLWFPHTPVIINGLLHYCDSMRGTLHNSSWKTMAKFNGFIRGITYSKGFYYIGQSTHRYVDRVFGTTENISLDTGVFLLDPSSKATKFYSMPMLTDINAVLVID